MYYNRRKRRCQEQKNIFWAGRVVLHPSCTFFLLLSFRAAARLKFFARPFCKKAAPPRAAAPARSRCSRCAGRFRLPLFPVRLPVGCFFPYRLRIGPVCSERFCASGWRLSDRSLFCFAGGAGSRAEIPAALSPRTISASARNPLAFFPQIRYNSTVILPPQLFFLEEGYFYV